MKNPGVIRRSRRDYCPVALPYFGFMWRRDDLARLRRRAYGWAARKHPAPLLLRQLRFTLTWPILVPRNAMQALREWGRAVRSLHGVSLRKQLLDMIILSLGENISPENYYIFGLWRPAHRQQARLYLQEFEVIWLCEMLNEHQDAGVMKDKLRFHDACVALGLPTIPVLAAFAPGKGPRWYGNAAQPPGGDLFIKPAAMACGAGVQRWLHDEATATWRHNALCLQWKELLQHLEHQARTVPLILQSFVANHPDQQPLTGGALATLRILACKLPGEPARAILCSWRMPVGGAEADNFSVGGIVAAVEADGRLRHGVRRQICLPLERHPDTDARIAGERLPQFAAMCELALRAHDALQFTGFVGWDVACGADGPVLVEGNPTWGPNVIQCAHDAPLGDSAVEVLIHSLLQNHCRPRFAAGPSEAVSDLPGMR